MMFHVTMKNNITSIVQVFVVGICLVCLVTPALSSTTMEMTTTEAPQNESTTATVEDTTDGATGAMDDTTEGSTAADSVTSQPLTGDGVTTGSVVDEATATASDDTVTPQGDATQSADVTADGDTTAAGDDTGSTDGITESADGVTDDDDVTDDGVTDPADGVTDDVTDDSVTDSDDDDSTTQAPVVPKECHWCNATADDCSTARADSDDNSTCTTYDNICWMAFDSAANKASRGCESPSSGTEDLTGCDTDNDWPHGVAVGDICYYCCQGERCNTHALTAEDCEELKGAATLVAPPAWLAVTLLALANAGILSLV